MLPCKKHQRQTWAGSHVGPKLVLSTIHAATEGGERGGCLKQLRHISTYRRSGMQRHHRSETYGHICLFKGFSNYHKDCSNWKTYMLFIKSTLFTSAVFHTITILVCCCTLCFMLSLWLDSLCCEGKGSSVILGAMFSWYMMNGATWSKTVLLQHCMPASEVCSLLPSTCVRYLVCNAQICQGESHVSFWHHDTR